MADDDANEMTIPQRFRSSPLRFEDVTPGRQPLTMPGSTDAALAVKTERFPPKGDHPITVRAEASAFDCFARSASVLNGHRGCQPGDLKARRTQR
jgi:hypothetical protein